MARGGAGGCAAVACSCRQRGEPAPCRAMAWGAWVPKLCAHTSLPAPPPPPCSDSGGLVQMVAIPMGFYSIWAFVYFVSVMRAACCGPRPGAPQLVPRAPRKAYTAGLPTPALRSWLAPLPGHHLHLCRGPHQAAQLHHALLILHHVSGQRPAACSSSELAVLACAPCAAWACPA